MPKVIIRRRRGRAPKSLTAAAQRVDPNNSASFRSTTMGLSADGNWQEDAWVCLEKVGELQYFVSWRSWSASRCRLVASAVDDQGAPTGSLADDDTNAEKVRAIVNDIAGGVAGQAKLIRRAAYLLSVPGECWIGMLVRDPGREEVTDGVPAPVDVTRPGFQREQWFVFGREQISKSSDTLVLKLPDGTKHEFDPDVDLLFHLWDEHPRDPSKPVSPVWAVREVLHGIIQADQTIKAANNSRLVGNGILFVPQEMSLPEQQAPVPVPIPLGTEDLNVPPVFEEPNTAQKLQDLLFEVGSTAKRDPNSQAAQMPLVAAVPGEMIKDVHWLRAGSDVPETTLKIQEADIRRLAMGLDVAPERLLGMSQGNHWSAWAIDESDIKVHVAPVVEIIVSGLTQEVLRQKLAEEDIDPDAYVVWYDTTALTQDPDKSDEAQEAFDRGALTARALREHSGFDDEDGYDLTTRDGWIELALDKVAQNPANAAVFGPIIVAAAQQVGLEVTPPRELTPAESTPAEDDAPADAEPPEPDDTDEPDDAPLTAALTVARLCVNRALELANKRRRTRADTTTLRNVPITLAHTVLGPVEMGEAADLIRGWATGLSDEDLLRLDLDPGAFRAMVTTVSTLALVTASEPVLTRSMLRKRA